MARPKGSTNKLNEESDIMDRIRVIQDYVQYIVIMDVSEFVPFSQFGRVDTIFPKMGLQIKRNFGYLGFSWGYGKMVETTYANALPTVEAPVSLNIYFQNPIDNAWLEENKARFQKIYNYIAQEWAIYKGTFVQEYAIDARN